LIILYGQKKRIKNGTKFKADKNLHGCLHIRIHRLFSYKIYQVCTHKNSYPLQDFTPIVIFIFDNLFSHKLEASLCFLFNIRNSKIGCLFILSLNSFILVLFHILLFSWLSVLIFFVLMLIFIYWFQWDPLTFLPLHLFLS